MIFKYRKICALWQFITLLLTLAGASRVCAEVDVVSSCRDNDLFAQYESDAQHITEVSVKLGYHQPPVHRITFVPSIELGEMSSIGHYPLPHWRDGSSVVHSQNQVSGVLEFVTRGESVCRSFYSDTTPYWQQLSVIMHVMGHNDFGLASNYKRNNNNDTMETSLKLAEKVSKLYEEYDHDEVSQYLQWLYSLEYLQDFVHGSYDEPDSFKAVSLETDALIAKKTNALKKGAQLPPPSISTASILAAFIHNLPADAPAWKKDLTASFEQMTRQYSGSVNTKVMNEGWATFSQYLLAKHSQWRERADSFIDLGHLLSGVAYPQLSNPYWLGLECWLAHHRRFIADPNIAVLDELAQDRAFVSFAHELMAWQSDYTFVRGALDAQWVQDQKFFLYRKATPEEIQAYCQGDYECMSKLQQGGQMTLSRNAERIINDIARENVDHTLHFPQLRLRSFNYNGSGSILLVHDASNGIPLKLASAVQTQLVLALVMERPIRLETITLTGKNADGTFSQSPLVLTVSPRGTLQVEGGDAALSRKLQGAIDAYLADLQISNNGGDQEQGSQQSNFAANVLSRISASMLTPIAHSPATSNGGKRFLSHSPTSGAAILEYKSLLEERLARMMQLAVNGQINSQKGQKGVTFRVLPIIPHFELDSGAFNWMASQSPPSPVDERSSLPSQSYRFGQDDDATIGRSPNLLPGDIFKKPEQQGEGEGEGDDGEPEEDGDDAAAGAGGQDPSNVEVPIKEWGQALQELIGLPNMRRTLHGESSMLRKKKRGTKRREYGEVVYRKMVPRALAYPVTQSVLAGETIDLDDMVSAMIEGFKEIRPSDYVVKNRKEVPLPTNKAVIVVVMDFSGSMQGEPHKMAANFVYNFKALLLSQYDEVTFRYVVYDTKAHEFSEDDVFGRNPKFLGGGTSNVIGYEKAEEILAEYDYEEWNKYVVGLGDAGASDGPETAAILERIYPDTQFISFIYTDNGWGGDSGFLAAMEDLAQRKQWVGYTHLKDASQGSIITALKELYPPQQL